jgi:hypothetical protein
MHVACMRPRRQCVPRWPKIAIQARATPSTCTSSVPELLTELATIYGLGVLDQLEAYRHMVLACPVATNFRRRLYARS